MAQLVLAHFSGLLVKNRNLLPTGMEITPYNKHRRLLLPQRLSSSSTTKERLPRIEREPSLLSHQGSRPSLDANLGRGRFGQAHRTFSTHDLWPGAPPKPVLLGWERHIIVCSVALARSESNGRQCECVNTHNIRL